MGGVADAQRAEGIPRVWGKVPQQNKNFTGRDDLLTELHQGLTSEPTAVLHGFGGVGKTQVAVEYAYRFRADYDVVWWVSADQPVLVRSALAGLAPRLGLPAADTTGIEDAANAVLDALRSGRPYGRWLLIYDNVDGPEDLAELIPGGPGHVLITSRDQDWDGVPVTTVAVNVFPRADSVRFLDRRMPMGIGADDADRLAGELGDLPLALEQAAAFQAETGMSVDQYLELLTARTSALLAEGKPLEYPLSMTAAWTLSAAALTDRLPRAVALLRCCAFFGPAPIPLEVFHEIGDARLAGLLADPILLSGAIRELGRYALVRIDEPSGTIQVHRLIQALARDELDPAEQSRYRHAVHLLLAGAAPDDPDAPWGWPRYSELLAHIAPADVKGCSDERVRQFAVDVVRYLYRSGDYLSAREFVEGFLAEWVADGGERRLDVLVARRHLGIVLRELGQFDEAYELNRDTLAKMRGLDGAAAEILLLTNSCGADLRARGEFTAARRHDEKSLERHRAVFGPGHPRTLRVMNNLALDYGLISEYEQARDLCKETYKGHRRLGASEAGKAELLNIWGGLARAVRLCGGYREACDVGEEAYAYGVREVGPEHPWTLRAAKDLSIARRRLGDYDESRARAEDVRDRFGHLYGPDHPDTLAAAMALSNVLRAMGLIEDAFALAADTAERYPGRYGLSHPYNHGCAGNLALLLRLRGDPAAARDLNERCLTGIEARLGRDHHYTLTIAGNLAGDLAELGDAAGARLLGEATLPRACAILGEDHPVTLACAANLAVDGKRDDILARYRRTLGPSHPDTLAALDGRRLDLDFDPPPI